MEENVKVVVRIRPHLEGDSVNNNSNIPTSLIFDENNSQKLAILRDQRKGTTEFTFSEVLGPDRRQDDVYKTCKNVVQDVLQGINCSILAYGQTGSGKTFSLLGQGWEDNGSSSGSHLSMSQSIGSTSQLSHTKRISTPSLDAKRQIESKLSSGKVEGEEVKDAEAQEEKDENNDEAKEDIDQPIPIESSEGVGNASIILNDSNAMNFGVIPKCLSELFDCLEAKEVESESFEYTVTAQFMQIYNEKIYDLQQDKRLANPLPLRDTKATSSITQQNSHSVYVQGLSEYKVQNKEEIFNLLRRGLKNRAIRSTEMNAVSSRSHTILQLAVNTQGIDQYGGSIFTRSVLHFVDLAGSEKWKTTIQSSNVNSSINSSFTQSSNDVQKEMLNINTSLHTLGNCVSALIEPNRKHIPYRDSVLTRLLSDSLGGNGKSVLIATIRLEDDYKEETISTLQFASRASKIKSTVIVQQNGHMGLTLDQARREIALLRQTIEMMEKERIKNLEEKLNIPTAQAVSLSNISQCEQCLQYQQKVQHYESLVQSMRDEINELKRLVLEKSLPYGAPNHQVNVLPSNDTIQSNNSSMNRSIADQNLFGVNTSILSTASQASLTSNKSNGQYQTPSKSTSLVKPTQSPHSTLKSIKISPTSNDTRNFVKSEHIPFLNGDTKASLPQLKVTLSPIQDKSNSLNLSSEASSLHSSASYYFQNTKQQQSYPSVNNQSHQYSNGYLPLTQVQQMSQGDYNSQSYTKSQLSLHIPNENIPTDLGSANSTMTKQSLNSLVSHNQNMASYSSMASALNTNTIMDGGVCVKHELVDCVLCKMFGNQMITKSENKTSTLPSTSVNVSNSRQQPLQIDKDTSYASSTSFKSMNGKFCTIHYVTDCLLCSLDLGGHGKIHKDTNSFQSYTNSNNTSFVNNNLTNANPSVQELLSPLTRKAPDTNESGYVLMESTAGAQGGYNLDSVASYNAPSSYFQKESFSNANYNSNKHNVNRTKQADNTETTSHASEDYYQLLNQSYSSPKGKQKSAPLNEESMNNSHNKDLAEFEASLKSKFTKYTSGYGDLKKNETHDGDNDYHYSSKYDSNTSYDSPKHNQAIQNSGSSYQQQQVQQPYRSSQESYPSKYGISHVPTEDEEMERYFTSKSKSQVNSNQQSMLILDHRRPMKASDEGHSRFPPIEHQSNSSYSTNSHGVMRSQSSNIVYEDDVMRQDRRSIQEMKVSTAPREHIKGNIQHQQHSSKKKGIKPHKKNK